MSYSYTLANLKEDMCLGIPGNVTEYLFHRIQKDTYRGLHLSQHNRYTKEIIIIILKALKEALEHKEAPKHNGVSYLRIRTTDLSKRPLNTSEEALYAQMTNQLSRVLGRITQDSLRKNFFVDMERMGFICRFNKKLKLNAVGERHITYYVNLSPLGKEFLQTALQEQPNPFTLNRLWTSALTNLHGGFENTLYALMLELSHNNIQSIGLEEFAFFASDTESSQTSIVALIKEFRVLSRFPREQIVACMKKYANPKENSVYQGCVKTALRDYHNWINEAQQMFMLLKESVLFGVGDVREGELSLRVGDMGLIKDKAKLKRSQAEKEEYFKQHKIDRQAMRKSGFELHHIVPLALARDQNEFSILDRWQNMILIDGYKHAQISQNGSRNIRAQFKDLDIDFEDSQIPPHVVSCVFGTNIKYNPDLKDLMQMTNANLLQAL
ncbi:type II restriction endonuclease subunit R [Helicobacter bizzozeronii]|uniref:type II restriction endonuclease subunit R n=1 Tax=Helicobacter bizzozeronii TaxID=56877 RepID=UPI000CEED1F2|nr:type II restriction endonuclease subunit R [Helicobacter bizzozeronii]